MKSLLRYAAASCLFLSAGVVLAGEIVPDLDDAQAIGDYTVARAGVLNPADVPDITTGEITLAARFNPDASMADAAPVIVIEDGGTSNGTGLYIVNGDLVLAAKAKNAAAAQPASMNDTDFSDGCCVVILGPVTFGVENKVYASINLSTGKVFGSVNGMVKAFTFTGINGTENLDGNHTVSFLGSGEIVAAGDSAGSMGGLLDFSLANPTYPELVSLSAVNMVQTAGYTNQRGQVFPAAAIPPQFPSNPTPADGAENIDPATVSQLSFTPGQDPDNLGSVNPDITGYYITVYDSWNGEPNYAVPVLLDTVVPAGTSPVVVDYSFTQDETVCWQVEERVADYEKGDPNNFVGPIWSFSSIPSIPVVTDGPVDTYVPVGGSAQLSVTVASITTPSYTWYFSADDVIGDDAEIGTDSPTYSVVDALTSQQGYYYCSVINASGQSVNSPLALLEVGQLVAYYSFDAVDPERPSVVIDSSALGNDGTALYYDGTAESESTLNYAPGFIGDALVLGTDEMKHAQIPCSVRNNFTIEAWVKTSDTAGTGAWWYGAGIVDGEMAGYVADYGLVLSGSKLAQGSGPSGDAGTTIHSVVDINDGNWHYCVATREVATGEMKLYVDGHREATATADIGSKYSAVDLLNIGKIRTGFDPAIYFTGAIDEVKIYNYAMSEVTIAETYMNFVPGIEDICIESQRPDAAYDLDGNCIINIGDLALMAGKWLTCGLYPDCIQ